MFSYPITIDLILLNAVPNKFASNLVFKVVVLLTFVFSVPDVLNFLSPSEGVTEVINLILFAKHSLGCVLAALVGFV